MIESTISVSVMLEVLTVGVLPEPFSSVTFAAGLIPVPVSVTSTISPGEGSASRPARN